jgi:NAD(P)-dependent dehydrogenase (short-subunit alcohol dehydrogenase family)
MIHLYASEAAAFASLVLFILLFGTLWVFRVGWSREASAVDVLVVILSCAFGCRVAAKGKLCQWPPNVDFTGRVALVVGGSSGVGYSTAMQLAEHGWTVILAARNTERLMYAKKSIERHVQRSNAKGEVKVLGTVDLRSDASICAYVRSLAEVKDRLPVGLLIMAAGALHRHLTFVGEVTELKSGAASVASSRPEWRALECMIVSNAVGPFLFTQLMLPLLDETAEKSSVTSRIVNVGSSCHTFLGLGRQTSYDPIAMLRGMDKRGAEVISGRRGAAAGTAERGSGVEGAREKDPYYITDFSFTNFVGYYGLSKLCVMWNTRLLAYQVASMRFTKMGLIAKGVRDANGATTSSCTTTSTPQESERQNQLKIFVACAHPGIITTYLYRELFSPRVLDWMIYYPSLVVGKTWFESAQSTLKAAVEDTGMVQGGYYLCGGEYGPDSGVNCVSAHAQSPTHLQAYREWLMSKVAPAMTDAEKKKE